MTCGKGKHVFGTRRGTSRPSQNSPKVARPTKQNAPARGCWTNTGWCEKEVPDNIIDDFYKGQQLNIEGEFYPNQCVLMKALGNPGVLLSGMTTGIIGYALGNYLGVSLALLLQG